jgi:hypothetical protein
MVARTIKIMGSAYSTGTTVSIECEYNGTVVYSGMIPTIIQNDLPLHQPDTTPEWKQELATFMTDTDTTGVVPCRITVLNGTLFFGALWMNYINNRLYSPNPNPPHDIIATPVAPMELFGSPKSLTLDIANVSNTKKNGVIWNSRTNIGDQLGDWTYPVYSGETFAFDFFVDPDSVILRNWREIDIP